MTICRRRMLTLNSVIWQFSVKLCQGIISCVTLQEVLNLTNQKKIIRDIPNEKKQTNEQKTRNERKETNKYTHTLVGKHAHRHEYTHTWTDRQMLYTYWHELSIILWNGCKCIKWAFYGFERPVCFQLRLVKLHMCQLRNFRNSIITSGQTGLETKRNTILWMRLPIISSQNILETLVPV